MTLSLRVTTLLRNRRRACGEIAAREISGYPARTAGRKFAPPGREFRPFVAANFTPTLAGGPTESSEEKPAIDQDEDRMINGE
jgi:hypothetical protein